MLLFFAKIRRIFIFSNYIEKVDYFTLDLLKRSDTQHTLDFSLIATQCGPLAWIEKQAIKTGPTDKFLYNKKSTRMSGPQINIKI